MLVSDVKSHMSTKSEPHKIKMVLVEAYSVYSFLLHELNIILTHENCDNQSLHRSETTDHFAFMKVFGGACTLDL